MNRVLLQIIIIGLSLLALCSCSDDDDKKTEQNILIGTTWEEKDHVGNIAKLVFLDDKNVQWSYAHESLGDLFSSGEYKNDYPYIHISIYGNAKISRMNAYISANKLKLYNSEDELLFTLTKK